MDLSTVPKEMKERLLVLITNTTQIHFAHTQPLPSNISQNYLKHNF